MDKSILKAFQPYIASLALISTFFTHKGFSLLNQLAKSSWLERASDSVAAIGVGIAVYLTWHVAFYAVHKNQELRPRLVILGLVMTIALPVILAASSYPNASGLSGQHALNTEVEYKTAAFEVSQGEHVEAANKIVNLSSDIALIRGKIERMADDEHKHGVYSGSRGKGAVHSALTNMAEMLKAIESEITTKATNDKKLSAKNIAMLAKMRKVMELNLTPQQRMKEAANIADKLRENFKSMSSAGISASIARALELIPKEASGLSANLSSNAVLAARQKQALVKLESDIADAIVDLSEVSAELARSAPPEIPKLVPITPMAAVAKHWRNYLTAWAVGILVDTAPLLPLIFVIISGAFSNPKQRLIANVKGMSVEELIAANYAKDALSGSEHRLGFSEEILKIDSKEEDDA